MSGTAPVRNAERGFTLIEVMITLVILAFGLLGLAAMQLHAMKQGSAGRHTGDGSAIARSYLEQAARLPWTTLGAVEGTGWVDPVWANEPIAQMNVRAPSGATRTEHAYTVLWRVTNVGVTPPICLRDVEVRVTWAEEGFPAGKTHAVGTRRYNQGDPSC